MRKNKSFLALSALGVIALILMVAAGVLLSGQRAVSFRADGYVLDTAKQDDDTLEVVTDQFVLWLEVPGIPILWERSV